MDNTWK